MERARHALDQLRLKMKVPGRGRRENLAAPNPLQGAPGESKENMKTKQKQVTPRAAAALLRAARRVLATWAAGDLAAAVRDLSAAVARAEGGAA